jgi:hypothetical protein
LGSINNIINNKSTDREEYDVYLLKEREPIAERIPKQTLGRSPSSFFSERIHEILLVEDGSNPLFI